jgi:sugar lactone lactonase YvrE
MERVESPAIPQVTFLLPVKQRTAFIK